jgi:prepilin-type N-terminal cleavage/methylation domain-containing protein
MRGKQRAFTLIELMISIAILAIMLSVATASLFEFGAVQRQAAYSQALANGQAQLSLLRAVPFDTLPPQVLTAAQDGTLQLAQTSIVPDSIVVKELSTGQIIDISEISATGLVRLQKSVPGQKVVVDYDFFIPGRQETHFVDDSGVATLQGGSVLKIHDVFVAEGAKLKPTSDFKLAESGRLQFPKSMVGRLVVIDYEGERFRNIVSGQFLDGDLSPSDTPSETKLMEVKELYHGPWSLSLPLLREKKP